MSTSIVAALAFDAAKKRSGVVWDWCQGPTHTAAANAAVDALARLGHYTDAMDLSRQIEARIVLMSRCAA